MITVCQHCGHEHNDIEDSKNGRMIKCVSCEKYFKVTPKKDESQLNGELEAPDMPVRTKLRIRTEANATASVIHNYNPATAALMASAPVMSRVVKPVAMAVPVAAAPVAAAPAARVASVAAAPIAAAPVAVAPAARVAPVAAAPIAAAPVAAAPAARVAPVAAPIAAAPVAVAPAVRVAPVAAAPVVAVAVEQKK